MTYASEAGKFSIALGGDCMLTRPITMFDEPEFLAVAKTFRESDVGFVNLETVVRRWDEGTPGITRGTYMTTAPELLQDLKWFGINMVCTANNHAYDYGEAGLLATMAASRCRRHRPRRQRKKSLRSTHAGLSGDQSGPRGARRHHRDLPAVEPSQCPAGRHAGRPGINPFPFANTYTVDAATFDALKNMNRKLGFEQARVRNRRHFYSEAEAGVEREEELEAVR